MGSIGLAGEPGVHADHHRLGLRAVRLRRLLAQPVVNRAHQHAGGGARRRHHALGVSGQPRPPRVLPVAGAGDTGDGRAGPALPQQGAPRRAGDRTVETPNKLFYFYNSNFNLRNFL